MQEHSRTRGGGGSPWHTPTMRRYLADVGHAPLLTREDELALGERMQAGRQQARRSFLRSSAAIGALVALAKDVSENAHRAAAALERPHGTDIGASTKRFVRQVDRIRRLQRQREKLWIACANPAIEPEADDALATKLARLSRRQFDAAEQLPLQPTAVQQMISGLLSAQGRVRDSADVIAATRYAETKTAMQGVREGEIIRRRAADVFVRANVRLVLMIARRYTSCGYDLEDLIQEGNLGLMRAVDGFDHTRGFRFSSYGSHWIRQAIVRGIANRARLIRVPVHVHQRWSMISAATKELTDKSGREPDLIEVARRVQLPVERVEKTLSIFQHPASLDAPLENDSGRSFSRSLADEDASSPYDETVAGEFERAAHELLATLSGREAYVLRMRFGIGVRFPATLAAIGETLGLTRERTRQIQAAAIKKLQQEEARADLREVFAPEIARAPDAAEPDGRTLSP